MMKVSNASRGSSGEPPRASCTVINGTLVRDSAPFKCPSCVSREGGGSAIFGLTAIGRIAAERTLSSRRVIAGSSDCQVLSTRSL